MVKLLFILFVLPSVILKGEPAFKLTTELSKERVYQGESFTVTFFLESSEDRIVEVEVMKFPEFRGFWSENILLRQGPLHVVSLGKKKGLSRAAVGAYTVQSILGTTSPSIEPMKLLVRSQESQSLSLESSPADLTLMPLPVIPVALSHLPFVGAVGNFRLHFERTQIPYRQGQPFLVRGELSGEGNFSEVSSIPLQLDPSLKLISEQVFSDSQYGRSRKVFEWSLESQEKSQSNWTPGGFLFFDPLLKIYQKISFPSFSFVLLPEIPIPESILPKALVEFPVEMQWEAHRPWLFRQEVLWLQGGIALLMLLFMGFNQGRRVLSERDRNPMVLRKKLKKKAERAFENRNWDLFFPMAIPLAKTAFQNDPSLKEALNALVQAERELRFSPEKTLNLSSDSLEKAWQRIYLSP